MFTVHSIDSSEDRVEELEIVARCYTSYSSLQDELLMQSESESSQRVRMEVLYSAVEDSMHSIRWCSFCADESSFRWRTR